MRIRTIKPEFWSSLDLAPLSEPALLLAAGLLNYADDEGYFVADERLIRAALQKIKKEVLTDEQRKNLGEAQKDSPRAGVLSPARPRAAAHAAR